MSLRDQFSKPRTGGGSSGAYTPSPIVTLKGDGTDIYRLFPAMKSGAANGSWMEYHTMHWGYEVENPKNPQAPFKKPFRCIRRKGFDGMIHEECPQCKLIERKKTLFDQNRAKLLSQGRTEDEIKSILTADAQWLRQYNADGKHHIAVKHIGGDARVLKIPTKAKNELLAKIDWVRKNEGIEPFDIDTGVWFVFHRTGGKGGQMNFTVEVHQEDVVIEGRRLKSTKLAPLTDADLEAGLALPDLKNDIGTRLTAEQIQALVDTGGDRVLVGKILNASTANVQQGTAPAVPKAPAYVPAPAPVPVAEPVAYAPPVAPVAAYAPPVAAPAPVASTGNSIDDMSDDEFFAKFG